MKTRYFYFLAAAVLLAGCNKEVAVEQIQPEGAKTVLTVGLPSETKTVMDSENGTDGHKVYWSPKDQIAVNGISSVALADDFTPAQSAQFTINGTPSTPYNVVYPASITTQDDYNHVTLPAVQTYKDGGFADGMFPMAGHAASGSDLELSYLCSIVKISVKRATATDADTDNIVSVRFKGKADEQVSGVFSIDYENATLTGTSSEAEDKVVKVVKSQATSTTTAIDYYIVVPARTYASGFDVIVQDSNSHIMTKSKSGSWDPKAGKLYVMPPIDFEPTGTELGVVIASAQDLVDFATAFNQKKFDEDVVATVVNDISFDASTSAAFNATNGIGQKKNINGATEDNYFTGVFNGNDHTISGLEATVPIFAFTQTGSLIEGLKLDNTCTYTVNADAADPNHGPLVGRNKGSVKDCISEASVTINNIEDVNTVAQHYGGLVGRNYGGNIDGCTVRGDITCSQTGQTITKGTDLCAYIGGIAGTQADKGTINNCAFTGDIAVHDGSTYGGITAAGTYFYVAGIVGYADDGVITECTTGIDGTSTSIDVRGTLVPAIGGIVGWCKTEANSEIRQCYNYMSLSFASNGARANTTPCRIGGIAARSAAPLNYCNNFGAITSSCNSTTLYLGGIAAEGASLNQCVNNTTGTVTRTNADQTAAQANRYIFIGGIMGAIVNECDVTGCTNNAPVTCNPTGTSSASTVDLGGIVGGGTKQIDISGCSNAGEVKFDNDNASAAALSRKAIGGILGNAATDGTAVTECSNSGKIWSNNNTAGVCGPLSIGGVIGHTAASSIVTDCTNSGEILCQNPGGGINAYVDLGGIVGLADESITIKGTTADATLNSGPVTVAQASSAVVYARNTQGGILGFGNGNDTKIINCKNSAQVYCNLTGVLANNRPSYTGGIVGLLADLSYTDDAATKLAALTGVEIGYCNNTGKVNSSNYNNRAGNKNSPFAGGLVGLISGSSEALASIHDCSVSNQVYSYRGTTGGVIAYANYCSISNSTCSADMSGVNVSVNGVGGIAGRLFDGQMNKCTFSGKIARAKNIGGLAYTLSEQTTGSSISECKVDGATLTTGTATDKTQAAVLVSITDDKENTITDSGVKGTLDGIAIALSSNMITTDGGATVSGTYLLP